VNRIEPNRGISGAKNIAGTKSFELQINRRSRIKC
jgi:hypothetical protein